MAIQLTLDNNCILPKKTRNGQKINKKITRPKADFAAAKLET